MQIQVRCNYRAKTLKEFLFILPLDPEQQKDGECCIFSKRFETVT